VKRKKRAKMGVEEGRKIARKSKTRNYRGRRE